MEAQRDASSLGGGLVKDSAVGAVAAALVTVWLWKRAMVPPPEIVLAMQVLVAVALGFLRRVVEELSARSALSRLVRVFFKRWLKRHDIPVEEVLDATVRIDPPKE